MHANSPNRLAELDILRALAVLLVVGRHVEFSSDASALLAAWHCGGWVGVDLFFVLSGFLVSGLLFREYLARGTIDIKRFLIRRGLKIYPAFYAFFLLTLAPFVLWQRRPATLDIVGELLFLQNAIGSVWEHTWSLAVEEHFYLGIAALVAVLVSRRTVQRPLAVLPAVLIVLAVAALALRLANVHEAWTRSCYSTPMRIDSLGFGVLLAYGWHFHGERMRARLAPRVAAIFVVGLGLLAPAFVLPLRTTAGMSTWGFTAFYVGSGLLLMSCIVTRLPDWRFTRLLALVGRHSYSIYLWHMPVILWLVPAVTQRMGLANDWATAMVAVTLSVGVGLLMSRLVELPVLWLRERYFPSRSAEPLAADAPPRGEHEPLPADGRLATS